MAANFFILITQEEYYDIAPDLSFIWQEDRLDTEHRES